MIMDEREKGDFFFEQQMPWPNLRCITMVLLEREGEREREIVCHKQSFSGTTTYYLE
jgi:hypothetical protein